MSSLYIFVIILILIQIASNVYNMRLDWSIEWNMVLLVPLILIIAFGVVISQQNIRTIAQLWNNSKFYFVFGIILSLSVIGLAASTLGIYYTGNYKSVDKISGGGGSSGGNGGGKGGGGKGGGGKGSGGNGGRGNGGGVKSLVNSNLRRDLSYSEYKKIYKALGDLKMDNDCGGKPCNTMFNEYMKTRNIHNEKDSRKNIIKEYLDSIDKKNDKTGLINQAIFIIYELIACNVHMKLADLNIYQYGTWEWWKANILNAENQNPIQRYIYILSAILCSIFLFYSIFIYGKTIFFDKIFGFDLWQLITIGIVAFLIFVFSWISIGIMGEGINKSDKDQTAEVDANSGWTWTLISFVIALVFSTFVGYVGKNTNGGGFFAAIAIGILIGLILAFNSYYMLLIPQLVIVAIILQKYILSSSITDDILATIIKGVLLVVILFASFFDTSYGTTKGKNNDNETLSKDSISNKQVWYVFGLLMAMYAQNIFESLTGITSSYKGDEWSLLLAPMAKYILMLLTTKPINNSILTVSNGSL